MDATLQSRRTPEIASTPSDGPQPAMTPGRRSRCGGFTILEVALAAAVMAMGISTSIVVMQRGFAMLDTARNITTSGQLLASQMEQLRMLDYTTVSGYIGGPTSLSLDSAFTSSSSVGSRFTLTRTVSTTSTTDMLEVTYSISWRNYDGRTMTRSMTTYYAKYGIHDYYYNHT
jgi:Tfp pilus assembly protein PilV